MNVSLTPELKDFVEQKVSSGLYKSESQVVREGLRLLVKSEAQPSFRVSSSEELLAKLQEGIDSLDAGKAIPSGDVFRELAELGKGKTGTDGQS